MGIRVKKIIGFGLTDVKTDKSGRPTDPRFNPDGIMSNPDWEEDRFYAKGYKKFVEQNYTRADRLHYPSLDMTCFGPRTKKDKRFCDNWYAHASVIHEGEFGAPNVMVVVPFWSYQQYARRDDTLDWCEETTLHGQSTRVVELSEHGIYPYNRYFWDPLTRTVVSDYDRGHYEIREQMKAGHLQRFVPAEVRAMCEYLKVFSDPEYIQTLKPLLYVYWS